MIVWVDKDFDGKHATTMISKPLSRNAICRVFLFFFLVNRSTAQASMRVA
jgi:hypothetical protein